MRQSISCIGNRFNRIFCGGEHVLKKSYVQHQTEMQKPRQIWIYENMATEISLIYPLTEPCSGAFFFSWLLFIYLIGTG